MPNVAEIEEQINRLDPVEQEELFERLIPFPAWREVLSILRSLKKKGHIPDRTDHPGVVRTPDICGGSARIIRTRIPVWSLERMRQLGMTEADILRSYPSLRAVDLVQAWSYADQHRDEIERDIRENEEE